MEKEGKKKKNKQKTKKKRKVHTPILGKRPTKPTHLEEGRRSPLVEVPRKRRGGDGRNEKTL